MKKLLLLTASVLLTMGLAAPAQAHHQDPTMHWSGCNHVVYVARMNTTGWTTNETNRIQDAIGEWNSERNACDPIINFDSSIYPWDGCNSNAEIIVQKVAYSFIGNPGNTSWVTNRNCNGGATDVLHNANVQIGTNASSYWGNNIPEGTKSDIGEYGVLVHELGHALGFVGHWQFQEDHADYCIGTDGSGMWRTMCNGAWNNYENYSATLNQDDVQWFNNDYT